MNPDPFKLDRTAVRFMDKDRELHRKAYEHYKHLTPAQRIACVEQLRQMWHGPDALNARLPRVLKFIERP